MAAALGGWAAAGDGMLSQLVENAGYKKREGVEKTNRVSCMFFK